MKSMQMRGSPRSLAAVPLVVLLAAVMALAGNGTARAAETIVDTAGGAPSQTITGRLTLFANPDFTGTTTFITYPGCSLVRTPWQAGSYDNRPPTGCRVLLRNAIGAVHQLCIGRAVVPVEFRQRPHVIALPGNSLPCLIGPVSVPEAAR